MTKNLDAALNELSYEIFKKLENADKKFQNLCDKALWVLANDWPYAFVLFIISKNAQDIYLKPIFEDDIFSEIFWFEKRKDDVLQTLIRKKEEQINELEDKVQNERNESRRKKLSQKIESIKTEIEKIKKIKFESLKRILNENEFADKNSIYKIYVQKLSEDLHNYLYFKTLLEKLLIYVRYHLKTLD